MGLDSKILTHKNVEVLSKFFQSHLMTKQKEKKGRSQGVQTNPMWFWVGAVWFSHSQLSNNETVNGEDRRHQQSKRPDLLD